MKVHAVEVGSLDPVDQCQTVIVGELAWRGYRSIERTMSNFEMFSKSLVVQHQTPLDGLPPPPVGGMIGLRMKKRDDGGCLAELQSATYDCLGGAPGGAYVQCELTPGAPAEVNADIDAVVAGIVAHRKRPADR
ncbi:MAG TPA: hypothetical protein VGL59_12900 [Polyangia bacterium]|jgi:hypothetical protein